MKWIIMTIPYLAIIAGIVVLTFLIVNCINLLKTVTHMPKTPMLHRFVVKGGYITSQYDNDEHFITNRQLVDLYELSPGEYIIWNKDYKYKPSDILLTPLYDGHYYLHKQSMVRKFYELQKTEV